MKGLVAHFLLTLELNFRNKQAIVYGYLVPVIFLFAFGSLFRADEPPLLARMGQIVTITILGGACFGLPTSLVAERELGFWQKYRLLPVSTAWLLVSTMLARVVMVSSSVLVQVALARALLGTPLPNHPAAAAMAGLCVMAAFLGIGLLIAALADTVPAVQALGQCIFLPMIMIGGVGVPLAALPAWVQRVAGFMPGRYSVELLQPAFDGNGGGAAFRSGALLVIGLAAGVAGVKLFRWEAGPRTRAARWWVAGALASWAAVGLAALQTGQLPTVLPESAGWTNITEAQIAEISFEGLPRDNDIVAALARSARPVVDLASWPPGKLDDAGQSIRNLVSLAALADLCADPREAQIARVVFQWISSAYEPAVARQALAWIILNPEDGHVVRKAPELGLPRHPPERLVRQRSVIYAQKYLGRLAGKIAD